MVESRRSYSCRCRYWNPVKDYSRIEDLINNKKSDGIFFAKEAQQSNKMDEIDNGIVMIDKQYTSIETLDDISKLHHKAIVEYLGQYWIVDTITAVTKNRTTEYMRKPIKIYTLSLRNGD